MIFLAKYGKYELQVRPMVVEAFASGGARESQSPLYASFLPNQHSAAERDEALKHFYLVGGSPQNVDEASHVEPDYRIGRFDSRAAQEQNGWSDEDRELVEKRLLEHCAIYPEALLRMPEVAVAAPWPAYDTFKGSPAQLAKKVADDGYDPHEVIAYEMEHQNRDTVIAALGQLAAEHEELAESDLEVVG